MIIPRRRLLLPFLLAALGLAPGCALFGSGAWLLTNEPDPSPSIEYRAPRARSLPTGRAAWRALTDGEYARAHAAFLRDSRCEPSDGRPLVGAALAQAAMGHTAHSAQTMGRVLRYDPDALGALPEIAQLDPLLNEVVARYEWLIACDGIGLDPVVALGAVHYLRGDTESARDTVRICTRLGRRTLAVVNLESLLDARADDYVAARRPIFATPVAPAPTRPAAPPATTTPQAQAEPKPVVVEETVAASPLPPPPPPSDPVDYDKLRGDLKEASDTLDRFTQRLLDSLTESARPKSR